MKLVADRVQNIDCHHCGRLVDVNDAKPFTNIECPGCHEPVTVPAGFGDFRLLRVLGRGAMARVFEAEDLTLGRRVAVKVLSPPADTDNPEDLANRCLDEARALAALNHQNVVQVYSIGEVRDQPYIVMELVTGSGLNRRIAGDALLEEQEALAIGVDVATGLRAAQQVGLIHGDVKPGNILLDPNGVAKLVDFGIARFMESNCDTGAYGTPQYVAPEVVLKRTIDFRSDIFSLGATLFHALTGEYPFRGKNPKEIVLARLNAPVVDPRVYRRSLCRPTAAVVAKMLRVNPDRRYATYEELIEDLHAALERAHEGPSTRNLDDLCDAVESGGSTSKRKTLTLRTTQSPPRFSRRLQLSLVIAGTIAGLFAVLLVGSTMR